MRKVIVIYLLGFLLLFIVGLEAGRRVFGPADRSLDPVALNKTDGSPSPGHPAHGNKHANKRNVRLALSSFDLMNGLTVSEMEDLSYNRAPAFYMLLACLMLIPLLRKPSAKP